MTRWAQVAPPAFIDPDAFTFVYPINGFWSGIGEDSLRTSYVQEWNLTIAQELGRDYALTAAYIGKTGRKIIAFRPFNAAPFIPGNNAQGQPISTEANADSRAPFLPGIYGTRGLYLDNSFTSAYHSVQIEVNKRFSGGLQFNSSYTLGKSLDSSSTTTLGGCLANPFDVRDERGRSTWDRRHAFVFSGIWTVPAYTSQQGAAGRLLGGWSVSGISYVQSGSPVTITAGQNTAYDGTNCAGTSRGDLVASPERSHSSRDDMLAQFFERNAFVLPQFGRYGTSGRGIFSGPALVTTDLAILKDIMVREGYRFQLRAEFANAFNQVNFSNPISTLTDARFGAIIGKPGRPGDSGRVEVRVVRPDQTFRRAFSSLAWILFCGIAPVATPRSGPQEGVYDLIPNQWVELRKDPPGARRASAIRFAPAAGAFLSWGFMNADPNLLQEQPLMEIPEYDVVGFDPRERRWLNHLPKRWESQWSKKLPLAYIPRTYSGITTGSERTVLRGLTDDAGGAPRPDLNVVFDQVSYHPPTNSLIYFTGGLTAAYDTVNRRWSDLAPKHSPPPVLGGSLAHDPVNDEIVLFGGGHVAESGPDGRVVGHTGTWVYRPKDRDWQALKSNVQPPPRMNMRMVCDTRNQVLVLFGGDAQSHYLADTWLYDLKTRTWRASKAPAGPEARAGHFTVYDPVTGWVLVGGGYNHKDLADMWAYDAVADQWQRLLGQVPTGFYITGDIAPENRLIVLVTNTRKPDDTMSCNILYPVRTTYGYRIDEKTFVIPESRDEAPRSLPKRLDAGSGGSTRIRRSTQGSGNQAEHSAGEPMGASFRSREDRACPHLGIGYLRHQPGRNSLLGRRPLRLRRERYRHL